MLKAPYFKNIVHTVNEKVGRTVRSYLILMLCLLIAVSSCSNSLSYVKRYLFWNIPDVQDYKEFPYRIVHNTSPPFSFKKDSGEEARFLSLCRSISYQEDGKAHVADLEEFLTSSGTTAFIVIKNDTILYENYFNGHTRDSLSTSFSITKSFTSALVGIALDEGHIKSIDDPVTKYLPELRGKGFEHITIKHLLEMVSGIEYSKFIFPWDDKTKVYYWPDLRQVALEATVNRDMKRQFYYNDYHPLLLGLILERVLHRPLSSYLQEKIWESLGMEYPASWSIDSTESGFEKLGTGINARAIDLAKFGRLFLRKGVWNGKRIISEQWVSQSTSEDKTINNKWEYYRTYDKSLWKYFFSPGRGYYKYFWWGYAKENGCDFFAMGSLGQFIYICPEKDVIIVRLGERWGPIDWWPDFFQYIINRI